MSIVPQPPRQPHAGMSRASHGKAPARPAHPAHVITLARFKRPEHGRS